MKSEPNWTALPGATPTLVRSVMRRCLQKDPARRLRDIADARLELQEAMVEPAAAAGATAGPASVWTRALPWTVAAVCAAAAVVGFVRRDRTELPTHLPTRLELSLPAGVEPYVGPSAMAFLPDGTRFAFVGNRCGHTPTLRAPTRRVRSHSGSRDRQRDGRVLLTGWPFDCRHPDGPDHEESVAPGWTGRDACARRGLLNGRRVGCRRSHHLRSEQLPLADPCVRRNCHAIDDAECRERRIASRTPGGGGGKLGSPLRQRHRCWTRIATNRVSIGTPVACSGGTK